MTMNQSICGQDFFLHIYVKKEPDCDHVSSARNLISFNLYLKSGKNVNKRMKNIVEGEEKKLPNPKLSYL